MSVTTAYTSALTATETLTTNVPDVASNSIVHNGFNKTLNLNSTTTPATTKTASFVKALSAGAGTIDLTALFGTNNLTTDGTGLKVIACKFQAVVGNANVITLKFGASNPYNLLGASWQVALQPGQEILLYAVSAAPVIGSGAKNIDLSGTGSQSVNCIIVMG